ncbi:MAG TPA: radical SAM protein, partial [Syntrophales bacterium]|nr:radical SAM protein [Syntrophales bacterium]
MVHDQQKDRPAAGPGGGPQVPFHLMAKPAGPVCNLRCRYCFYREKEAFFPGGTSLFMPEEVLEAYTREYIRSQPGPSVLFEWQGGEPALAGLDFFRKALEFQKKYNQGKEISNSFQTNGTLLDESWCAFLSKNRFLVGLSLDGPEAVHDAFRVDRDGGPTFSRVLDSLRLMQKHGVEFNVLAAVNRESAKKPLEIYRFFREKDVRFIQFVPIVGLLWAIALIRPNMPKRIRVEW